MQKQPRKAQSCPKLPKIAPAAQLSYTGIFAHKPLVNGVFMEINGFCKRVLSDTRYSYWRAPSGGL